MDVIRLGRQLRALRRRAGLIQAQLAECAGVSRSFVSRLESGRVGAMPLAKIRRCAEALGASLDPSLRWHGEQLDRLLDEARAELVDAAIDGQATLHALDRKARLAAHRARTRMGMLERVSRPHGRREPDLAEARGAARRDVRGAVP